MAANKGSKDLKITRIYDAPVSAVWDAWTDPVQTAKWWGPRGFSITTLSKDLRVGGHWKYIMHGPDGTNWDNKTVYLEVEEFKKLVYDHGGSDDRPPLFRVTVLFSEVKGKTKMQMTMTLPSPEAAAETAKFVKQAGGNSTWDRLAEFLAEQDGREQFVINRTFDVSIETLLAQWRNTQELAKWNSFEQIGTAKALDSAELVFTFQLSNQKIQASTTFVEESADSTRVTVTCKPENADSLETARSFTEMRGEMANKWKDSFDRLDHVLGTDSW